MATNICSDAYRKTWQVRLNHLSVPEVELSTTFWGSFIFSIFKITETLCIFIKLYIYHIFSGGFCHRLNEFKVFIYLSFIDYPIIMNVCFSYGIQLSYSSTEYIIVLRCAGKGHEIPIIITTRLLHLYVSNPSADIYFYPNNTQH